MLVSALELYVSSHYPGNRHTHNTRTDYRTPSLAHAHQGLFFLSLLMCKVMPFPKSHHICLTTNFSTYKELDSGIQTSGKIRKVATHLCPQFYPQHCYCQHENKATAKEILLSATYFVLTKLNLTNFISRFTLKN